MIFAGTKKRSLAEVFRNRKDAKSLRLLTVAVTLFVGCLRLDDIMGLCRGHVKLLVDCVQIFIPRSKTDQFRVGKLKFLAASKDEFLCPKKLLENWLAEGVGPNADQPLFPMLSNKNKPVSKTTLRDNLKEALADSELERITFHSFRAGCATEAINKGADPSEVREYGLWASDQSMQRYTQRNKERRLRTGRLLGL